MKFQHRLIIRILIVGAIAGAAAAFAEYVVKDHAKGLTGT